MNFTHNSTGAPTFDGDTVEGLRRFLDASGAGSQ